MFSTIVDHSDKSSPLNEDTTYRSGVNLVDLKNVLIKFPQFKYYTFGVMYAC